ncbi:MAG: hypothetical protein MI974_24560 [Chitinophagales bacterium]|nr:hypothetical protein [Chitinophagales bacterium]
MGGFFSIIKYDYLQRTRSYAFLLTLCASLVIAYSFIPGPDANYYTIRIANHVGVYNSAWLAYVTAIMASVFISLLGFYLINSNIKKDIDTGIGQIIGSTQIKNVYYLLAKTLSNFLLLGTLLGIVFLVSILLFFVYNDGFDFELITFVKAYLLIPVPMLFLTSVLAVVFEVLLVRYSVLQNIGFFLLFSALLTSGAFTETQFAFDVFGTKIVMHEMEESVRTLTGQQEEIDMSIGYVLSDSKDTNGFIFNGLDFPTSFIISRVLWSVLGLIVLFLIAPFFHRFKVRQKLRTLSKKKTLSTSKGMNELELLSMPKPPTNYSILPLIKMEFWMLIKQGSKWLWLLNITGIILLIMLPLKLSHQMILPALWFLQVGRLSSLSTKEITNNAHYFAFTAYKPLSRLLLSQLVAAIILLLLIAAPLIIRLGIQVEIEEILSIILGSILIVSLAVVLGIASKGKKLFEVLFFLITYANLNKILILDYFGGMPHNSYYLMNLLLLSIPLLLLSFIMRKKELRNY